MTDTILDVVIVDVTGDTASRERFGMMPRAPSPSGCDFVPNIR